MSEESVLEDSRPTSFWQSLFAFGGDNSLQNSFKSVRRASTFRELQPLLKNVLPWLDSDDEETEGRQEDGEASTGRQSGHGAADERTPLVRLSNKLNDAPRRRARDLRRQREENYAQHGGHATVTKRIRRSDGTEADVVVGESTLPQTVFNSSNILMGIGMLSLPLALVYTGWVIGLSFLVVSALVTKYTAGHLAKCLDVDKSLTNFSDISFIAFGERGRAVVSTMFTLELLTASVSLVILFADSLASLVPTLSTAHWKIIAGLGLCPITFIPINYLSYSSILGICCLTGVVSISIIAGFLTTESPGSLRNPAATHAFPQNWRAIFLGWNLIMSVFGGHSVFPNVYRDMARPWKYPKGLNLIFLFTTMMNVITAVVGLLMFGNAVEDELSTSILLSEQYPRALRIAVLILVAIVPITKFPLHCLPIVNTLEVLTRIDPRAALVKPNRLNQSRALTLLFKSFFRILTVVVIIVLSIVVPSFEIVTGIFGSLCCFWICVVAPCVFHLKMFGGQITRKQRLFDGFLIVSCSILGVVGFVWEFLPRSWTGVGR